MVVRIADEAPLTLVALTRGAAVVASVGDAQLPLRQGDVLIALGAVPYTISDEPETAVQVVVAPGPRCLSPDGQPLNQPFDQTAPGWHTTTHGYVGVRTWGNTQSGAAQLLVRTYRMRSVVGHRLTSALPTLAALPAFGRQSRLFTLLSEEITSDAPGQDVVLDRLLDLLLVATAQLVLPSRREPAALVPGRCRPGHRARVANAPRRPRPRLAGRLARRRRPALPRGVRPTVHRAGRPAAHRLPRRLAAGHGRGPAVRHRPTLDAIARSVGYSSPFALSTAFMRVHGISPQEHRRASAAAPIPG
jgi:AraC-like DNA-binding protein